MGNRRGGIIYVAVNGQQLEVKGDWEYNLGGENREGQVGANKPLGYIAKIDMPELKGDIADSTGLDIKALKECDNVTITLELAVGDTVVFQDAFGCGDWKANTEDGKVAAMFQALSAERIK